MVVSGGRRQIGGIPGVRGRLSPAVRREQTARELPAKWRLTALGGGLQAVGLLAAALELLALVGPRLRPHLAAREREPQDRALHHPELLEERPGVVGQLVAL